ncbi:MAG: nucleotide-binding protein [Polyangiaceae bacterium]|nr:nucleotide-binding protein [Polyangiaceae bacterium]
MMVRPLNGSAPDSADGSQNRQPQRKPRIFIGSSVEGLDYAEQIQAGLDYLAEPTIWHQGVFGLSKGTLESLLDARDQFDFAVLVLTPDDMTFTRKNKKNSPRDNVLFELGLFMGALGRDRTFIVYCRDKEIDLPTDLWGYAGDICRSIG